MKKIYLDNAATTKISKEVFDEMKPYFNEKFGNSSSLHSFGRETKQALEKSREIIAKSINAKPKEIIFTSGGTEGNNFIIKGIALANKNKGNHLITTKIEHESVKSAFKFLESQGFKITFLDVDKFGFIDLNQLKESITEKTTLVSIIHGNNEIGTIQNINEIIKICKEKNTLLHIDACQSYLKTEIDVKKQNLDLITLNAHKIHGPKGVGAVYIKENIKINPLLNGGQQEFGLRGGTSNIPNIVGFAKAVQIHKKQDLIKIQKLQQKLLSEIKNNISSIKLNGPELGKNRLCHILNISFRGVEGEAILSLLNSKGIAVSTGSACSSNSLSASHVLKAIKLPEELTHSSIRFSLSKYTNEKEIQETVLILKKAIENLRKISPYWKK